MNVWTSEVLLTWGVSSPVGGLNWLHDSYDDTRDLVCVFRVRINTFHYFLILALTDLVTSLQRVQQTLKKNGLYLDESVTAVGSLMQTPEFQQILAVHNKVQDVWCFNAPPTPISAHGHQLVQEVSRVFFNLKRFFK